ALPRRAGEESAAAAVSEQVPFQAVDHLVCDKLLMGDVVPVGVSGSAVVIEAGEVQGAADWRARVEDVGSLGGGIDPPVGEGGSPVSTAEHAADREVDTASKDTRGVAGLHNWEE